jgi:hypothetical protein
VYKSEINEENVPAAAPNEYGLVIFWFAFFECFSTTEVPVYGSFPGIQDSEQSSKTP